MSGIYERILKHHQNGRPQLAVLIDPDKLVPDALTTFAKDAASLGADLILVGGSLLTTDRLNPVIRQLKENTTLPVVIFPGSIMQVSAEADALLFLSLISGRNADYLIGNHVIVSPILKQLKLEPISTGYMLIESGRPTSASYMSNSFPIPNNKPDIAAAHALAADYLGLKQLYLEGGSGADEPVPDSIITAVRQVTNLPVWVGGGIRTPEVARQKVKAGASVIVIGTHFEKQAGYQQVANFAHAIKA